MSYKQALTINFHMVVLENDSRSVKRSHTLCSQLEMYIATNIVSRLIPGTDVSVAGYPQPTVRNRNGGFKTGFLVHVTLPTRYGRLILI